MAELLVFHSGNPNWRSCRKAIVVAENMKEIFGEKLQLGIHLTDSKEALKYQFKSSTNVLLNGESVPLEVSTNNEKMKNFINRKISSSNKK